MSWLFSEFMEIKREQLGLERAMKITLLNIRFELKEIRSLIELSLIKTKGKGIKG